MVWVCCSVALRGVGYTRGHRTRRRKRNRGGVQWASGLKHQTLSRRKGLRGFERRKMIGQNNVKIAEGGKLQKNHMGIMINGKQKGRERSKKRMRVVAD